MTFQRTRRALRLTGAALAAFAATSTWAAPVSITTLGAASTENFNGLASTGTGNGPLLAGVPGWEFLESGANANTLYTANNGGSNTGDTYSYGATNAADRALGGLQSGNVVPTIGVSFINNTGSILTSLIIAFTGEQWRLGALGRTDRLDFQYSTTATGIGAGTYIDVDALDFTAPVISGTVGALDGNLAANRTARSFNLTGLSIATNSSFYLRWNSFDATGADDGLAIDDFSLTANGTAVPEPTSLALAGLALVGMAASRRRRPV